MTLFPTDLLPMRNHSTEKIGNKKVSNNKDMKEYGIASDGTPKFRARIRR
jgi:hypothetical protein